MHNFLSNPFNFDPSNKSGLRQKKQVILVVFLHKSVAKLWQVPVECNVGVLDSIMKNALAEKKSIFMLAKNVAPVSSIDR